MDNLGKKYRELRKSKKINIYKACKNITSTSSLQRWERGEGNMPIEKVVKLLDRIHIQPKEYVDYISENNSKLDIYTSKVASEYEVNDIAALQKDAIFLLAAYQSNIDNLQVLFQAAIACNYYMDLTNENLFTATEELRLKAYLFPIENWSRENVVIFANTQLLLDSQSINNIAKSLLSYLIDKDQKGKFFVMSINALLNAVFVLLKKKDKEHAFKLLKQVKRFNLSNEYSNEVIRIEYAQAVIWYINNHDMSHINQLIQNLESIGLQEKAQDYKFGFSQYKELY